MVGEDGEYSRNRFCTFNFGIGIVIYHDTGELFVVNYNDVLYSVIARSPQGDEAIQEC